MFANGPGRKLDLIRPCLRRARSYSSIHNLSAGANGTNWHTSDVLQRSYHQTNERSHWGNLDQLGYQFGPRCHWNKAAVDDMYASWLMRMLTDMCCGRVRAVAVRQWIPPKWEMAKMRLNIRFHSA